MMNNPYNANLNKAYLNGTGYASKNADALARSTSLPLFGMSVWANLGWQNKPRDHIRLYFLEIFPHYRQIRDLDPESLCPTHFLFFCVSHFQAEPHILDSDLFNIIIF